MAAKKKRVNVYALANEPGTAGLAAFLATNPEPRDLDSLLQQSSQHGRADAMALLLALSDLPERSLGYALRYASDRGHVEVVRQLLAREKGRPHPDAEARESPLCDAA